MWLPAAACQSAFLVLLSAHLHQTLKASSAKDMDMVVIPSERINEESNDQSCRDGANKVDTSNDVNLSDVSFEVLILNVISTFRRFSSLSNV